MMHPDRGTRFGVVLALSLALGLGLAAEGLAQSAALDQARETLRLMREARKARETRAAAPAPVAWGHFLKQPEVVVLPPDRKPEVRKPDLNPTGTIRVGSELRVVVGTATFRVGDEILPGYQVRSIAPRLLTIARGEVVFEYPIR